MMGTFGQFCIQIHSKQSLTCRSDEILFVVDFGEDIFDIIINFICYFYSFLLFYLLSITLLR